MRGVIQYKYLISW
uniref:Uncharacterized protein n=1 Tax=Anguilla anguilla TaxID=7936 RepID=A0A0E9SFB1_ANGAN